MWNEANVSNIYQRTQNVNEILKFRKLREVYAPIFTLLCEMYEIRAHVAKRNKL